MESDKKLIFLSLFVLTGFISFNFTEAEKLESSMTEDQDSVVIPDNEFVGYFDSNGIYTVVGAIKNHKTVPIIPTVVIKIQDEQNLISKYVEYVPISPSKDLPFKIKFPEVKSKSPILREPEIYYIKTQKEPLNVEIIYDKTLVKHDDQHITGRIINNGNQTVYNIKVFALVNGFEHQTLDMAQNINVIEKLEPGAIQNFSMYPDPSITSKINYYSCFAVTDSFVRPVYSERNENKYYFRYDSGAAWYTDPQFNQDGTVLTMRTLNSFPLETYTNFEFPKFSDDEKFDVFLNGNKKKSIQSIDEWGNWHVAFNVEPNENGEILITGFKEGWELGDKILIPDWIKINAFWWSEKEIDDEPFVRGLEFLIKEGIIDVDTKVITQESSAIPEWIKINAGWWADEKITDQTFVMGLEYLIKNGIIRI